MHLFALAPYKVTDRVWLALPALQPLHLPLGYPFPHFVLEDSNIWFAYVFQLTNKSKGLLCAWDFIGKL